MQLRGVARCDVVVLHGATFACCTVHRPRVAPCEVFLVILPNSGGKGKVDANVFRSLRNGPGTMPNGM